MLILLCGTFLMRKLILTPRLFTTFDSMCVTRFNLFSNIRFNLIWFHFNLRLRMKINFHMQHNTNHYIFHSIIHYVVIHIIHIYIIIYWYIQCGDRHTIIGINVFYYKWCIHYIVLLRQNSLSFLKPNRSLMISISVE